MNVMVFDTETTSLEKPFCYNIGYVVMDTDHHSIVVEREFVVEQIWQNLPLFSTAYYAEKRPIYVGQMRRRKIKQEKFGYICQQMIRDIKNFDIEYAYAYNSPFDEKVFNFNCEWFKVINPFETTPIIDIKGVANTFITSTDGYKNFCEQHELFTESGNYSATAESVYRYIIDDNNFLEAHTALNDSEIESEILIHCVKICGAEYGVEYPVTRILPRLTKTPFTVKVDEETIYEGEYLKKYVRNGTYSFTTKL